ncbi:MAG: metal ABC transporter permease [Thaumarchaeota archaeon]|nr:metal ABC transporter permease [Nitrososphaerota archaeon]
MNLIYLILVAMIVAVGIKEVGTLLVGAVVIVPAAAARTVGTSLRRYSLLSAFGIISAIAGVALSAHVNVPAGPLVVIVGAVIFAIGLFAGTLYARKQRKILTPVKGIARTNVGPGFVEEV